ncbi:RNA polymerase sigma factor sigF, chloroplastic-like isoform X2 [Phragmites australis]|uniref:RNA polymerase sigma factor sigF, chloroplastic-like isoform X2 n=1 Tax=Phragmites australis TaxID=29695 RepID=UPI002D770AC2|nr:RNA polymerase sigma factor sigF, chloroplastic-like isoform X2 [Phragmites australis]
MNSSRSLLSSPLFASSSPNFRSTASISSSPSPSSRTTVPMIHDSTGRASTACHYSPSLVAEEQLHGSKDTLTLKGEKALLELLLDMALDQHVHGTELISQETEDSDLESFLRDATSRVLYQPAFVYGGFYSDVNDREEGNATSASTSASTAELGETLDLATPSKTNRTKEVVLPADEPDTSATQLDVQHLHCVDLNHSYEQLLSKGQVFIRSKRLLERRSKKRNAPRSSSNDVLCSVVNSKKKERSKKIGRVLDPDEPFKLFLRDRETTEFLTAKEEKHLFSQIQNLMKLEEAQRKLEVQCGREPTVAEWAQAVGMSCRELQSSIRTGRRCREKMARSNFRLVIHVARKYEGYGLDIQDLVQDGCCGLMKTFEKFNPSKGCRFPTYAYWWIRQSIKKSIFKYSRLIRLPESVFALQRKVAKARMECIMEGEQPTNVNVARRAGITIEKLARLRAKIRKPRSMQDRVWSDDGVTFQEITEDPNVEPPELSVDRLMMRQQVRDFLGILSPREKEIIEHRFGIHDGEPKTLHVIGDMYGLSKERIRQVQNRALDKLKKNISTQGFDVYFDLLT